MALFVVLSAFGGLKEFGLSLNNFFHSQYTIFPKEGKYLVIDSISLQSIHKSELINALAGEVEEKVYLNKGSKSQVAYLKGVSSNYPDIIPIDTIIPIGVWSVQETNHAVTGYRIATELELDLTGEYSELQVTALSRPSKFGFNPGGFNYRSLQVQGLYHISQELDNRYLITSIETAREILNLREDMYSTIMLSTPQGVSKNSLEKEIENAINTPVQIKTKYEQNPALYRMLNNEHLVIYFIFTLVMIIALFNLVGSLIMMIIDKRPQMKVLNTMGLTKNQIRNIFFSLGIQICLLGVFLGLLLGSILVISQHHWPFLFVPGTLLPYPVQFKLSNVLIVFLTVVVLGIICSWWTTYGVHHRQKEIVLR